MNAVICPCAVCGRKPRLKHVRPVQGNVWLTYQCRCDRTPDEYDGTRDEAIKRWNDIQEASPVKRGQRFTTGEVKCPFCGAFTHADNPGRWCPKCLVVFRKQEDGSILFDRNDTSFALARAITRMGGLEIGGKPE